MHRVGSQQAEVRSRGAQGHFIGAPCGRLVAVALLVMSIAAPAFAQLSGIQGTATDNVGGVLPGVIIQVTHLDTGTTQETVTDAEGRYFFQGLRIGTYELKAMLPGFAELTRRGLTVTLGQTATIDLRMQLATVEETIVVTGASPLVNLVQSEIGGNLDIKQFDETPINGRQWTMMTNLAPGARGAGSETTFAIGNAPQFGSGTAIAKVNVDGAQISSAKNSSGTNLDFSQYAIAEVEVLSNRFGAQYARAGGGVINAVTKSGANTTTGSFYGFFRDDALNAPSFFTNQVRPYHNRQVGALMGGPLQRNRAFYFVSWESERQPQRQEIVTGIPELDTSYVADSSRDVGLVKVDYQINDSQRLTANVGLTKYRRLVTSPVDHISNGITTPGWTYAPGINHVWALGGNKLNKVVAQFTHFRRPVQSTLYFQTGSWGGGAAFPQLVFPGATLGAAQQAVAGVGEEYLQIKDDFTAVVGDHSLSVGGELLRQMADHYWSRWSMGRYQFNANPRDWAAVVAVVEAGDREGLQRLVNTGVVPQPVNYIQAVGDPSSHTDVKNWGFYFQDDWHATSRLTLNLGIRYDVEVGALRGDYTGTRFLSRPDMVGRPNSDTDNWQPRFGFVFQLDEEGRTALRGGAGRYYDQSYANQWPQYIEQEDGDKYFRANVLNDRSPDFMSNPFVKYNATCTSALLVHEPDPRECVQSLIDAGLSTDLSAVVPWWEINYTDQYSIGVQHQLTDSLAVQADVVHSRGEDEHYSRNINLWVDCGDGTMGTYPNCTGPTLPVRTFGRPDPRFAVTDVAHSDGYSRFTSLQLNVTKRLSQGHSYQATYLLSTTESTNGSAIETGRPIAVQYGTSSIDERHRLTAVGSLALPWDMQFSGVFSASSGFAYRWNSGFDSDGDLVFGERAIGPDGSKLEVNPGRTDPTYRVDVRLAKRVRIQGNLMVEGIVEAFNLFNRKNYIRYQGNQRSRVFGQPLPSDNLLFQPRVGQVAFRILW